MEVESEMTSFATAHRIAGNDSFQLRATGSERADKREGEQLPVRDSCDCWTLVFDAIRAIVSRIVVRFDVNERVAA
jgi:hypothetical protein